MRFGQTYQPEKAKVCFVYIVFFVFCVGPCGDPKLEPDFGRFGCLVLKCDGAKLDCRNTLV